MRLARRSMLKGMSLGAGSLLLSPLVERLAAQATGAQLPKRFVFLIQGNGLNPDHVQPLSLGRPTNRDGINDSDTLVDATLADLGLPVSLEPLKAFQDRMTIVQGLSNRICGPGTHSNNFGALGCYPAKKGAYGETIDAALARTIPSIFPRVGLGITDDPSQNIIYNISAEGRGRKLPTQCRPDLAHSTLFGSVVDGGARRNFEMNSNVLDFMIDEVKRLRSRLVGEERQKLDAYLHAYESMHKRQSQLRQIGGSLANHAPRVTKLFSSNRETDRLESHFEIGAAALIGGLTNVLTIASGAGDPYFNVRFAGLDIGIKMHAIGHGGSFNGQDCEDIMLKIRQYHMQLLAGLAEKLYAVPEGDGTMLDNTVIVYTSDFGEAHHPTAYEWPFVIIGNLGRRSTHRGRYLCYPKYGYRGHRTVANLYDSLLYAAGAPRDDFGLPDPMLEGIDQSGPLQELVS